MLIAWIQGVRSKCTTVNHLALDTWVAQLSNTQPHAIRLPVIVRARDFEPADVYRASLNAGLARHRGARHRLAHHRWAWHRRVALRRHLALPHVAEADADVLDALDDLTPTVDQPPHVL